MVFFIPVYSTLSEYDWIIHCRSRGIDVFEVARTKKPVSARRTKLDSNSDSINPRESNSSPKSPLVSEYWLPFHVVTHILLGFIPSYTRNLHSIEPQSCHRLVSHQKHPSIASYVSCSYLSPSTQLPHSFHCLYQSAIIFYNNCSSKWLPHSSHATETNVLLDLEMDSL